MDERSPYFICRPASSCYRESLKDKPLGRLYTKQSKTMATWRLGLIIRTDICKYTSQRLYINTCNKRSFAINFYRGYFWKYWWKSCDSHDLILWKKIGMGLNHTEIRLYLMYYSSINLQHVTVWGSWISTHDEKC